MRLHVITDTIIQRRYSHAELAERAIAGGADLIQYRSKSHDLRSMIAEAAAVRDVCRSAGVTFIVNDRVDLALAVEADGVHLGREDMPIPLARAILGPDRLIGGTIRNPEHLREAIEEGADYVGLGPIFGTTSKPLAVEPLGLEMIRTVSRIATIPVIAIAGITLENVADVIRAGAHGVAVIGAVCAADDVTAAAAELSERIGSTTAGEGR